MIEFEPPFRSKRVLEHARGQPCTLKFPGVCNHDPETTVSAHIRDRHKGMAQKASDHSIVFSCSKCHTFLDEHWFDIDPGIVLWHVVRALQLTYEILIRDGIIGFPHDNPTGAKNAPVRARKGASAKIPAGRKLTSNGTFPPGRKLQSKKFNTNPKNGDPNGQT